MVDALGCGPGVRKGRASSSLVLHPRRKAITMKTLPRNFYTMPEYATTTMDDKDLKELLLETNGWVISCGHLYKIKSEHLGAGVYKVKLSLKFIAGG